jgi:hypothetical protein
MIRTLRHAVLISALLAGMGTALAQSAAEPSPERTPDLQLNKDQRHTIYSSISKMPEKQTAPPTFLPQVGAVVPESINLKPLPDTLVGLVPRLENYRYALVANQVMLVDPKSKRVVDVIVE